jgi:energy-coupling factor transporter ATP-binding protein EcfA2
MAISHVEIKDFMVFRGEFVADFCPGVNVIIGGNSTGKTTLLKVMYAALASEKDVTQNILERQFIPMRSVYDRDMSPPTTGDSVKYSVTVTAANIKGESVSTTTKTSDKYINLSDKNGNPVPVDQRSPEMRMFQLDMSNKIIVKSHVYVPEFDLLKTVEHFKREFQFLLKGITSQQRWFDEKILNTEQNTNGGLDRLGADLIHLYCSDEPTGALFAKLFNIGRNSQTFFTGKEATEFCETICQKLTAKGIVFSGVLFGQDLQRFVFSNGVLSLYEASGVRKFGLLWLLIKYKFLELDSNSILFWDEPENSLNPELMSIFVEILLDLSRKGVQIFIATHNYHLARYFDVRKDKSVPVMFHNLSKSKNSRINCTSSSEYIKLPDNFLETASADLFKAVVTDAMEVQDDE